MNSLPPYEVETNIHTICNMQITCSDNIDDDCTKGLFVSPQNVASRKS